jgi:hypothetical protein
MLNMAGNQIAEMSQAELLALFDTSVRNQIIDAAKRLNAEAVVCMENLQLDSSQCGALTALCCGGNCSLTVQRVLEGRIGDVPSRFQYPMAIWRCGKESQ